MANSLLQVKKHLVFLTATVEVKGLSHNHCLASGGKIKIADGSHVVEDCGIVALKMNFWLNLHPYTGLSNFIVKCIRNSIFSAFSIQSKSNWDAPIILIFQMITKFDSFSPKIY